MKKNGSDLGYVKIAAISPKSEVASPEINVKNALPDIFQAIYEGHAQVVVLPELCISAYTCADLFCNTRLITVCREQLLYLAEETATTSAVIVVGVPLLNKQQLFNCAAVIQGGKIIGVVPKMYLASYGEFNEKRWFTDGANCTMTDIDINGVSVPFGKLLFRLGSEAVLGIEICEDLWVPVQESSILSLNSANIIANLSASTELVNKNEYRTSLVKDQSSRCICGYAVANAGIGESTTDMVFSGACMIAENGSVLAESERFKQSSCAYADIDIQMLNTRRRASSFFENAKNYIRDYREIPAFVPELLPDHVIRSYSAMPFLPSKQSALNTRCREIFSIQTAALTKRVMSNGYSKLVIPVKNDLSSALALFVALNTCSELSLPPENVICLADGTDEEIANIRMLIDNIAAKPSLILLSDIYEDDYDTPNERERVFNCAVLNIADKNSALVVSTDSMSKIALYINKYVGIHFGLYSINASVPATLLKYIFMFVVTLGLGTDVKQLQKYCEDCVSNITTFSTKDGIPIEVSDFLLYHFIHNCFSSEKLLFIAERAFGTKYTGDELTKYIILFNKLFFETQGSRSAMPDSPAVGSVSLSQRCTWHMPSDAKNDVFNEFTTYDTIRRVPPIKI